MNMNSYVLRLQDLSWKPLGLTLLVLAGLCSCLYPGVGVGGSVEVGGYDGGYYEPGGHEYGGWGGGYQVGPALNSARGQERPGRPYRAAAPSRRMPSLPSRQQSHL
jgi:hypothetical protein